MFFILFSHPCSILEGIRSTQVKVLSKILLAFYLLTLLWLILFKFSLDLSSVSSYQTGLNLVPFGGSSLNDLGETIANFIVFMPFGLLLGASLKQSTFWRKFAFVATFSLVAEMIQLIFVIGTADITDVITNSTGGLLGLLLYGLSSMYVHGRKLDKYIVTIGTVLLIAVLGVLFSGRVTFQAAPGSKATLSSSSAAEDLKLDWPASGYAAIGTVEDGLLARSSDDEKLRPMASMAKVITAIAVMEKRPLVLGQDGQTYTLTAKDVANYYKETARDGSAMPVYEGMVITQYDAMQMMLLASANNIADTLAERTFGSKEAYVSYAQSMLRRKGFSRTVVADASGFNPDTASTPSELVALGIEALSNPVIAEIVAKQHAQIPEVGYITNTNQLLGADGVIGIKTGTTDEAGRCLLFAASSTAKDGKKVTIVGVIMDSKNTDSLFSDSRKLLVSMQQSLGVAGTETTTEDVMTPQSPQLRRRGQDL
jgi:D-alanyl-D-alanine carboxypeptidase (penicillin-binding protein 5/6)